MKFTQYESDFTKFLKELKQKDPELEQKQRAKQQPYVYQNKS
jgi:hypothetical protein